MREFCMCLGSVLLLCLVSCGSGDGSGPVADSSTSPAAVESTQLASGTGIQGVQKSALALGPNGEKRDLLALQHVDISDANARLTLMHPFPSAAVARQAKRVDGPSNSRRSHQFVYAHAPVLTARVRMERAQVEQRQIAAARQLPNAADQVTRLPARKSDALSLPSPALQIRAANEVVTH